MDGDFLTLAMLTTLSKLEKKKKKKYYILQI